MFYLVTCTDDFQRRQRVRRRPTKAYTPTDTAKVIRICSSADPSAALIASMCVYCSSPGFISKMYDHMGEPEATQSLLMRP